MERILEPVAGYIRVSTEEQKLHGYSVKAQKMKLQDYADTHNMVIIRFYIDEGVSGTLPIKKRPNLQRMIRDAENEETRDFKRILMVKLDRFFRNVAEYHECMKRIYPVTWKTTEEEYDSKTASGRMYINVRLSIAEQEADTTGERVKMVNDYKVKQGHPISGSVPFCFKIAETPDGKRVIKNPDTAHIMTDMLDYFLKHQNRRATSFYLLNKYGFRITPTTIKRVLTNSLICGAYRDNPNFCEPYIDNVTFKRLQKILPRQAKNNSKRSYIFSGLIICPQCGRKMGGVHSEGRKHGSTNYYRCPKRYVMNECGQRHSINESDLETLLLKRIEPMLNHAKKVHANSVKKDVSAQLAKLRAEIERLNYSWQKGRIDAETYDREFITLNGKIRSLESAEDATNYERIDEILNMGWKEMYEGLAGESKKAFWRSFIKEIHVKWDDNEHSLMDVIFL